MPIPIWGNCMFTLFFILNKHLTTKTLAMDFSLVALTLAISFLVFFFLHKLFFSAKMPSRNVPQVTGAWPIIGHLHLLNGPEMPHKIFSEMAEKYGPIFRLKLGVNQVVIVSDPKIVKECFTTNERAFANRPEAIASEILGYNYAMFGFGPYGPCWREIRKIATIEFLSPRRIEMSSHIREFEVKSAIKETYNYWLKNNSSNLNGALKMEMNE